MPWTNVAPKLAVGALLAILAGVQTASGNPDASEAPPQAVAAEKPALIMIDPAHGGTDPGALLTASIAEKDVTLNIARRLKLELNARGIASQLVREGDLSLTADQRAAMANAADPVLYISLHASSLGKGMRVFTALVPSSGDDKGPFLDWVRAQSATHARSKALQAQLVAAVQKTRFPTQASSASVRPLNSLRSPALAVEVSATTGDVAQVSAQGYQQMICAALANALASLRPNLGAHR